MEDVRAEVDGAQVEDGIISAGAWLEYDIIKGDAGRALQKVLLALPHLTSLQLRRVDLGKCVPRKDIGSLTKPQIARLAQELVHQGFRSCRDAWIDATVD